MSNNVQSVERAFSILEIFKDYPNGVSLTQISEKTNLHKSTVYRLLGTLTELGYVDKKLGNLYFLTFKLYNLAANSMDNLNIVDLSNPYMKILSEYVNEVVHLVVQDDMFITYINKIDADNELVMSSKIGTRAPLISTASGKAILANLPNSKVIEIFENNLVNARNFKRDFLDFQKELEEIRKSNIAYDIEDNESGIYCIGSPIFSRDGNVIAALSISGPNFRMKAKINEDLKKELLSATHNISKALGFNKSPKEI